MASAACRVAGQEGRLSGQGVSILDRAGLLGAAVPTFGAKGRQQLRLLLMMNDTEAPQVTPNQLISLVVATQRHET